MDWTAMMALGAFHGINPGMGWLFAVALGMQQGRAAGVWRALPPIALGHLTAVAVVVAIAAFARVVIPIEALKVIIAATLVTLGGYRLWRHRHPRFGGMQVGFRDLTIWSFLMASAHGAGVMVLPFVMQVDAAVSAVDRHSHHPVIATAPWTDALAVGVHSLTYLIVTALIAWVVYAKVGLAILRTAWFNLDWLWAGALVVTGAFILLS
jgi:threonine/homoserine/homoserine lactone efflux protein